MTGTAARAELILVPAPLGDVPLAGCLPPPALERIRALDCFIAESAKTARAFLKAVLARPLAEISIRELPRTMDPPAIESLLAPFAQGRSIGLVSEAGMPSIADPGQIIVRAAHDRGIRVVPLIGPSAVLLALAASGLMPQRFAFHGYLPVKDAPLRAALRSLERDARARNEAQLWIEAPYRNDRMVTAVLETCQPATRFMTATDLTLASEAIVSSRISAWRDRPRPQLDRRPTVFAIAPD